MKETFLAKAGDHIRRLFDPGLSEWSNQPGVDQILRLVLVLLLNNLSRLASTLPKALDFH